MDTEQDAALLLVELYEKAKGSVLQRVTMHTEGREPGRLETLAMRLHDVGLIDLVGAGMSCRLTTNGVVRAEQLILGRGRPVVRYNQALNGLVMEAADRFPKHRLELTEFMESRHARVLDSALTQDEVRNAARFLEEESLVTVERDGEELIAVVLTQQGRRCGWNDEVNVMSFLDGQEQSGIQQKMTVTVNGNGTQVGQGNTQNNTFGYDPHQLATFAREILADVKIMDIPEAVRNQVTEHAQALQREAEEAAPERTRIRRSLEGLREAVALSGSGAGALAAALQVLL
ncbi:hypothetical protein AB6O49_23690 [Streptomyces sp. SBR177]